MRLGHGKGYVPLQKRMWSNILKRHLRKRFVSDIIANMTMWPLIDYVIAVVICGASVSTFIGTSTIGGVAGFILAPVEGRWYDKMRSFMKV